MRSFPAYSRQGVWLGCSLSDRVVSSQGVTLTDLQEAERTFSRSRVERQAQEQPSLKPGGPAALEGGPRKLEPLAAPAQDAGESHQPRVRSPEGEASHRGVGAVAHRESVLAALQWTPPRKPVYIHLWLAGLCN